MKQLCIRLGMFASLVLLLLLNSEARCQWYKKATDGSLDPFNKNNDYGSHIDTNKLQPMSYETNKFDLKAVVEAGNWHVAWADDIAEKDVLQGLVAAGVSVASANPAPFVAWIKQLVDRTVDSLRRSSQDLPAQVKNEIVNLAMAAIRDAVLGKKANEIARNFGGIGVKAGAIRYSGANKIGGQVITRTWGIKPYIAVRISNPQGVQLVPVPPPNPVPTGFAERFRGNSGFIFEHTGRTWWIVRDPQGNKISDFEEVERNGEYIGLRSLTGFPHVRIHRDRTDVFIHNVSRDWQVAEPGTWQR
ncbi:MAG: hypothetical protein QM703_14225 [Gemmatales bacterium]